MQNRIPQEVFDNLQKYQKEYGIIWIRPTQNDVITKLMRRVVRLFEAQRRFRPSSQKSLMEYHHANRKAGKALDALKKAEDKKRPEQKTAKAAVGAEAKAAADVE